MNIAASALRQRVLPEQRQGGVRESWEKDKSASRIATKSGGWQAGYGRMPLFDIAGLAWALWGLVRYSIPCVARAEPCAATVIEHPDRLSRCFAQCADMVRSRNGRVPHVGADEDVDERRLGQRSSQAMLWSPCPSMPAGEKDHPIVEPNNGQLASILDDVSPNDAIHRSASGGSCRGQRISCIGNQDDPHQEP